LYTAMGPVVIWAFGSALVIPGAITAAVAGFPKVAGAASALAGFLQIGVGLAGTAVAALLFSDPLTALETVMPSMALLAMLANVVLPSKHERRLFAAAPEELETGSIQRERSVLAARGPKGWCIGAGDDERL
jgi:DHA1 family bicyclomycin/chloramphenicol resistance-like MFS transporter